ncbi:MAG TPA: hypothetical protein VK155_10450 [Bacteroidales bacterium]|jgi:hypothetical protein|nr:hypothetical protein [Bacteroidales bacterium]
MKAFLFCVLFLFSTALARGQNLVGCKYSEIRKYMRENKKDMSFNNVRNNDFNYLKYSNSSDSQTILFFLGRDSVCKSVRMILEPELKATKIKEMDSTYRKAGTNKWIDLKNGKLYNVELRDEIWSSVITIVPVK